MKTTPLILFGAAVLPLALGAAIGGRRANAHTPIPSVTVVATDYALQLPDTLPAGPTMFRLVSRGKEFHHLWIARLEQGRTMDDLLAALRSGGPLPAWVREVGGPNAPAPGAESNATVVLSAGSYVVACLIPSSDGVPHLMKGMVRPLTVAPAARPAASPVADVTMTLHDYGYTLSAPLAAGHRIIEVRNAGPQGHEVELVRLAPGKTAADVLAWLRDEQGPPPGEPLGGVSPLAPGSVAWFDADLVAGQYALICFLPDSADRKPHYQHGMVDEIEVASAVSAR